MKKILTILLLAALLIPMCAISVSAADATEAVPSQARPDWLITELSENQCSDGGDTSTIPQYGETGFKGQDIFEFIEIYNNSGKTLNLYDYCLTYNGNNRDNTDHNFEHMINETTPFLTNNTYEDKAGNFLDGTKVGSEALSHTVNEMQVPLVINDSLKNPATCEVAPNEIVILWFVYTETLLAKWHETSENAFDGTGATMTDFRTFYGVPDNVKVICVDANGTGNVGNAKNFNIKNTNTGTYGIAYYSPELNEATNTDSSSGLRTDGYWSSSHMVCWASMPFAKGEITTSNDKTSTNFIPDLGGVSAKRQTLKWGSFFEYVYSPGRMMICELNSAYSLGTLTNIQKLAIDANHFFKPGDIVDVAGDTDMTKSISAIVAPDYTNLDNTTGAFIGFKIDGSIYTVNETTFAQYQVPAGGLTSIEIAYEQIDRTTTIAEEEEVLTTPDRTQNNTTKPTDTTVPPSTGTTPVTDPPKESGCGGIALMAQFIAIICGGAVFIVIKKTK